MHVEVMEVEHFGEDIRSTPQTSGLIIEIIPEGILSVGPEQLVSPCICSLLPTIWIGASQLPVLTDVHLISVLLRGHFSFTRAKIRSFLLGLFPRS